MAATTGVSVPYCEIVFQPSLPVTVAQVGTNQGPPQDGPPDQAKPQGRHGLGAARSWEAGVAQRLNATDLALVSTDAVVSFRADNATTDRTGKITVVDESGVVITPDEPFSEAERGQNLRVSIVVNATSGEVLVVPLAAVSGTTDGLARVTEVVGPDRVDVAVRAGLTADGCVEVVPVNDGTLARGDSVVVGR